MAVSTDAGGRSAFLISVRLGSLGRRTAGSAPSTANAVLVVGWFVAALLILHPAAFGEELAEGATEADVVASWGRPVATVGIGDTRKLVYRSGVVVLVNGRVVTLPDNPSETEVDIPGTDAIDDGKLAGTAASRKESADGATSRLSGISQAELEERVADVARRIDQLASRPEPTDRVESIAREAETARLETSVAGTATRLRLVVSSIESCTYTFRDEELRGWSLAGVSLLDRKTEYICEITPPPEVVKWLESRIARNQRTLDRPVAESSQSKFEALENALLALKKGDRVVLDVEVKKAWRDHVVCTVRSIVGKQP